MTSFLNMYNNVKIAELTATRRQTPDIRLRHRAQRHFNSIVL